MIHTRLITGGIFLILLLIPLSLSAQDTAKDDTAESKEEEKEEKKEEERIRSLREERKETLLYGIDSQVLELIGKLKSEENERYEGELLRIFEETKNASIKETIVDFFHTMESEKLAERARTLLVEQWEELSIQLNRKLIRYLKEYQDEDLSALFFEMRESPRNQIAEEAVRALGASNKEEYAKKLRKIYDESRDDRAMKSAALEALGELQSEESIPLLEKIVLDEDENKGLRWKACIALGNIGGEEALDILFEVMEEDEPRLRQYAVQALGKYSEKKEISETLMQALRDNNWRVRVQAAESLGEMGVAAAVDILSYKAEHDPDVHNVRRAAVRALGKIGKNGAHAFLEELYEKKNVPMEIRGTAVEMLIEHNLSGSLGTIKKLMQDEWDEENSKLLDYTCKQLSRKESVALRPLFERMLKHPSSLNIVIYGLRGIRLNKFGGLRDEVERLAEDGNPRPIRSLALAVLEEL